MQAGDGEPYKHGDYRLILSIYIYIYTYIYIYMYSVGFDTRMFLGFRV